MKVCRAGCFGVAMALQLYPPPTHTHTHTTHATPPGGATVVGLAALAVVAQAALPGPQRAALASLYQATGGPQWLRSAGWLAGDPCQDRWAGVACDSGGTTVQ